MDTLEQKYFELINMTLPTGLSELAEEVHIGLDEYDGYIMGLASSVVKGSQVSHEEIIIDQNLNKFIDSCYEKISEYCDYKRKLDELAQAINNLQSK